MVLLDFSFFQVVLILSLHRWSPRLVLCDRRVVMAHPLCLLLLPHLYLLVLFLRLALPLRRHRALALSEIFPLHQAQQQQVAHCLISLMKFLDRLLLRQQQQYRNHQLHHDLLSAWPALLSSPHLHHHLLPIQIQTLPRIGQHELDSHRHHQLVHLLLLLEW